jgi:hypothetical protein
LVVLLVAFGGYIYWPYATSSQMLTAIVASDEPGLDKVVDWGLLRASVKEQMKPMVADGMRKRFGANVTKFEATLSSEEVLDRVLEQELNPTGLIRYTKGKALVSSATPLAIDSRSWSGISDFDVTFTASESRYRLGFKGLDGWKLVGAKFASKDGDLLMAKFHEAYGAKVNQRPEVRSHTESWLKDYQNPLDKRPKDEHGGGPIRR